MTDTIRLPGGATMTGVITFQCADCGTDVHVQIDDLAWDEIQNLFDEEICDRCDECRPDYFKRMAEADAADDYQETR